MKNQYNKPNFLIVGAAKAGTTSLARYLNQHSEIFIPDKKELRFFVSDAILSITKKDPLRNQLIRNSILNTKKYFKIFENRTEKLCGEASVHYLYHYDEAIPKILKYVGDIPIIMILRNPMDRAISNWHYNGKDLSPFRKAFLSEENRKGFNAFWMYYSLGLYYNQVAAYLNNFTSVKIILFDNFIKNTDKIVNETISFLGLKDESSIDTSQIHNKYDKFIPTNKLLKIMHKNEILYKQVLRLKKRNLLPENWFMEKWSLINRNDDRSFIREYYLDDIDKLEKLINYDLTNWKKV